jgi:hypothetical protein
MSHSVPEILNAATIGESASYLDGIRYSDNIVLKDVKREDKRNTGRSEDLKQRTLWEIERSRATTAAR